MFSVSRLFGRIVDRIVSYRIVLYREIYSVGVAQETSDMAILVGDARVVSERVVWGQVEAAFYEHVAPTLLADAGCPLPRAFLVDTSLSQDGGSLTLLLSDLRPSFPVRKGARPRIT